jgi:glycogen operon protein
LQFTVRLLELRRTHPAFRRLRYSRNIEWLNPRGEPMSEAEWKLPHARVLGALLSGRKLPERDAKGKPVEDDDLLLLLNAHHDPVGFALPGNGAAPWNVLVDTALGAPPGHPLPAGTSFALQGRSLVLLARPSE